MKDPADPTSPQSAPRLGHPLEEQLGVSAWEILDACQRGFRAVVAVRGKIAESQFEQFLESMKAAGRIVDFEMLDEDGEPDCRIRFVAGGPWFRGEVKNVHPEITKRPPTVVCETQKTRASKGDEASRFYKVDHFDFVAACLFNVTGKWEFLLAKTTDLARHKTYADRLDPRQKIPWEGNGTGVWVRDLESLSLTR